MFESSKRLWYHVGYYRLTKRFQKLDLPKLTSEEKRKIKSTWPGIHFYDMDFVHARIFKKIHGFSPYYKPHGHFFEACSEGRLLLLTPYPYSTQKVVLTRAICNYLNVLASRLSNQ